MFDLYQESRVEMTVLLLWAIIFRIPENAIILYADFIGSAL